MELLDSTPCLGKIKIQHYFLYGFIYAIRFCFFKFSYEYFYQKRTAVLLIYIREQLSFFYKKKHMEQENDRLEDFPIGRAVWQKLAASAKIVKISG